MREAFVLFADLQAGAEPNSGEDSERLLARLT